MHRNSPRIAKVIEIALNCKKNGFQLDYELMMRHLDELIKIKNREDEQCQKNSESESH